MKTVTLAAFLLALIAPAATMAGHDSPGKDAFDKMKTLVGKWEGKMGDGEQSLPATIEYKLTGSDTALVETLGAGSPFEMISVYHMDGDNLVMTHYCGAGNQPSMKLKPGKDANILFFDFTSGSNMKATDMHMHCLTCTLDGPDHLVQVWQTYKDGKPGDKGTFDFHRVK